MSEFAAEKRVKQMLDARMLACELCEPFKRDDSNGTHVECHNVGCIAAGIEAIQPDDIAAHRKAKHGLCPAGVNRDAFKAAGADDMDRTEFIARAVQRLARLDSAHRKRDASNAWWHRQRYG